MKIQYLKLWYKGAKRCSLLLLSSIFLFGGLIHAQNMVHYITLNVKKDSLIKITLLADANTSIQIVSGDSIYNITNTSTAPKEYKAGADTMTIYGDVKQLTCSSNKTNITKINVSSNNTLTFLACTDNNLDTLDVSNCSALTYLSCSYNNLTSLILNNSITNVSCHHNNIHNEINAIYF